MELLSYGKLLLVAGKLIRLTGEGELADVDWSDHEYPTGDVVAVDMFEEIPNPDATESLVLFFKNVLTKEEYLGCDLNGKITVRIGDTDHEVLL